MKLSDLFLPKIARSNPNVRKEAVKSETDVALLTKVLKNDSDPTVREAVKKRIEELSVS